MFAGLELFKRQKSYGEITSRVDVLLEAGCPLKQTFWKIYKKLQENNCTGVSFKAAGPQQIFCRRLFLQLPRTFNGLWSSKKI